MGPRGHTALHCVHVLICCLLLSVLAAQLSEGKRDSSSSSSSNTRAVRSARKQARADRCKNKRTWLVKTSDLEKTPLTLKCAHGPVVSAQVSVFKGKCRGTTGYTRVTAGRCMWNQTCVLGFQSRVIDELVPPVTAKDCLGQVPDKLQVGYTCLKKKAVVTDTLGTFKKTKRAAGLIRSHTLFPWSYRNGVALGNVTLHRPRKPQGLTHLWISVYVYSILNSDLLFLSWDDSAHRAPPGGAVSVRAMRQVQPNDMTFTLGEVTEVIMTFYANYTRHHSQLEGEQKGFLLCYQWLKPNTKPKKGTACNKVMMPAKCRGGKRGGRKRPSGSRNKNRRERKKGSRGSKRSGRNSQPSRNNNDNNNQRPRNRDRSVQE